MFIIFAEEKDQGILIIIVTCEWLGNGNIAARLVDMRLRCIVVGGIIADVAPSYRSEVGRLCLQCGSDNIRIWDKKTCPKCQGYMEETGEKEFWT